MFRNIREGLFFILLLLAFFSIIFYKFFCFFLLSFFFPPRLSRLSFCYIFALLVSPRPSRCANLQFPSRVTCTEEAPYITWTYNKPISSLFITFSIPFPAFSVYLLLFPGAISDPQWEASLTAPTTSLKSQFWARPAWNRQEPRRFLLDRKFKLTNVRSIETNQNKVNEQWRRANPGFLPQSRIMGPLGLGVAHLLCSFIFLSHAFCRTPNICRTSREGEREYRLPPPLYIYGRKGGPGIRKGPLIGTLAEAEQL